MQRGEAALLFKVLAYKDYIASRFLINNNFLHQGIILASSAVEKYLKLLAQRNNAKVWGHFDKLEKFRKEMNKAGVHLIDQLDANFLELLSVGYKLRYYDLESEIEPIGFIVHQLLSELDFAVSIIEPQTSFFNASGAIIESAYEYDIKNKKEALFLNNYVLEGVDKKSFMEKDGSCFMLLIVNGKELTVSRDNIKVEYKGKICTISDSNFPFKSSN